MSLEQSWLPVYRVTPLTASTSAGCVQFELIYLPDMPPRLCDPYAGPGGARRYLDWWGDALYRDWCAEIGVEPLPYATFCERTLQHGKDWWADEEHEGDQH